MEAVEAERLAAAEGLSLVPAATASGFRCVAKLPSSSRPFLAQIREGSKLRSLGRFSSAAEAALAYARHLGPAGCAAALARPAAPEPPMAEDEATTDYDTRYSHTLAST